MLGNRHIRDCANIKKCAMRLQRSIMTSLLITRIENVAKDSKGLFEVINTL
jgi:hypothetical protein